MFVHSISTINEWLGDYQQFTRLYGLDCESGKVSKAASLDGVELFLGWVSDTEDYGEPDLVEGTVVARKCSCCGHHEIGIEKEDGVFVPVSPGARVKLNL